MLSISSFRPSSSVDVSSDAYQKLLQKQLDHMKKNAAAIQALSRRADVDKKAWARQQVEEIKKQIEALRKLLLLFGGGDAKSLLQQLKQLASQLKQAANILNTPTDSGVADAADAPSEAGTPAAAAEGDVHTEGRIAYAEQQASADAEAVQRTVPTFDAQRAEDEKQLEAASRALKSLRATAERMAKQHDATLDLPTMGSAIV